MKHVKKFEGFNPYDDEPLTRGEKIFGKQTRLEKQFSEIVVAGLVSDDDDEALLWSTFTALNGEIKNIIGSDDVLYKEMQSRIVEGENPVEVMNDICSKLESKNKEMERLLNKLNTL